MSVSLGGEEEEELGDPGGLMSEPLGGEEEDELGNPGPWCSLTLKECLSAAASSHPHILARRL